MKIFKYFHIKSLPPYYKNYIRIKILIDSHNSSNVIEEILWHYLFKQIHIYFCERSL